MIREPATLLITNATRSDTAKYRCEVTAADDQKSFDEIVINLVVRGILIYPHRGLICICVLGLCMPRVRDIRQIYTNKIKIILKQAIIMPLKRDLA